MKNRPSLFVAAAIASAALLAACSGSSGSVADPGAKSDPTTPEPTAPTSPAPPPTGTEQPPAAPPADMKPLATTIDPTIVSTLAGAGLDVTKLPPTLEAVANDQAKLRAVMKTFTIALGVECNGCHAASGGRIDFGAPTPQKKVAAKMWSELVAKLAKKDGGAVYCDTCHQGKKEFVDRKASEASIGAWMRENFVGKLAKKDGSAHSCTTCHGEPFKARFLDDWEK